MKDEGIGMAEKLLKENKEFRDAYIAHLEFKKKVEKMERKPFLSHREDLERKRLKKLKLALKDKMEKIMAQHR